MHTSHICISSRHMYISMFLYFIRRYIFIYYIMVYLFNFTIYTYSLLKSWGVQLLRGVNRVTQGQRIRLKESCLVRFGKNLVSVNRGEINPRVFQAGMIVVGFLWTAVWGWYDLIGVLVWFSAKVNDDLIGVMIC